MKNKTLLILVAVFFLGGCSFVQGLWGAEETKDSEGAQAKPEVAAENSDSGATDILGAQKPDRASSAANSTSAKSTAAPENNATDSSLELLWQVPGEPIETYHIHYGRTPTNLDKALDVPVTALEKIDHPQYGPVFRYRLPGVTAAETIFLSLQAENSAGVSPSSEVIEIQPGKGFLSTHQAQ